MKEVTEDGAHPPIPENESGKKIFFQATYGNNVKEETRWRVCAEDCMYFVEQLEGKNRLTFGLAAAGCWEDDRRAQLERSRMFATNSGISNEERRCLNAVMYAQQCVQEWLKWAKGEEWE